MLVKKFFKCIVLLILIEISLINAYQVKFSKQKLRMVLGEWKNVTVFISNHENSNNSSLDEQIVLEFHSTNNYLQFSPQSIEFHLGHFSNWNHSILIQAQACGKDIINYYLDNESETTSTNIAVDVIRNRYYEKFGRKLLFFYYIFGLISFYPQLLTNFLHRSVNGLCFTYVSLNFVSHSMYVVFVKCMHDRNVQEEFLTNHPLSVSGTRIGETVIAINGLVTSICLIAQVLNYGSIEWLKKDLYSFGLFSSTGALLAICHRIYYMDSLYTFQFLFLYSSVIKYLPQLYQNFLNKSVREWNIFGTKLHVTANLFLLTNLIINSYNYEDANLVTENFFFWGHCLISLAGLVLIAFSVIFKETQVVDDARGPCIVYCEISKREKMFL